MIYAFEIKPDELPIFRKFISEKEQVTEEDYKVLRGTIYKRWRVTKFTPVTGYFDSWARTYKSAVLFRDRLTCEYTEMAWLMLKDEIIRNTDEC